MKKVTARRVALAAGVASAIALLATPTTAMAATAWPPGPTVSGIVTDSAIAWPPGPTAPEVAAYPPGPSAPVAAYPPGPTAPDAAVFPPGPYAVSFPPGPSVVSFPPGPTAVVNGGSVHMVGGRLPLIHVAF